MRFAPFSTSFATTLEQAMAQMMDLHEKRWRQKGQFGVFKRKRFRSFHLRLAKLFYQKGWLGLFFVWACQTPVAALYGFRYGQKFYFYQTGFDPEMDKFSVGNIVLLLCIKYSIENHFQQFDFLRGKAAYKEKFASFQRNNISILLTRKTFKGTLAYYYHLKRPVIKAWIKSKMPDMFWKLLHDARYRRMMSS